ncbi:MAG: transporter, partial [Actinomycetota bacterium]|nr:transporter [Actinomycetota bacterium]
LIASLSMFLCMTQTTTMPLWIPVLILCLYSAAVTASGIPLTNAIMNLAPRGGEGSASAFRGAAGSLGAALGVVLMSSVVYGTFEDSLTQQLTAAGQDSTQVAQVAEGLREGLSSEEVSSQYSVPLDTVTDIEAEQKQAMVDAYRAQGLVGGVIVLGASAAFFFNRRGLTSPAESPSSATA